MKNTIGKIIAYVKGKNNNSGITLNVKEDQIQVSSLQFKGSSVDLREFLDRLLEIQSKYELVRIQRAQLKQSQRTTQDKHEQLDLRVNLQGESCTPANVSSLNG